jgi:hypothetical protein
MGAFEHNLPAAAADEANRMKAISDRHRRIRRFNLDRARPIVGQDGVRADGRHEGLLDAHAMRARQLAKARDGLGGNMVERRRGGLNDDVGKVVDEDFRLMAGPTRCPAPNRYAREAHVSVDQGGGVRRGAEQYPRHDPGHSGGASRPKTRRARLARSWATPAAGEGHPEADAPSDSSGFLGCGGSISRVVGCLSRVIGPFASSRFLLPRPPPFPHRLSW